MFSLQVFFFKEKCHGMPGAMSGMQSRTAKWMGQHVPGMHGSCAVGVNDND